MTIETKFNIMRSIWLGRELIENKLKLKQYDNT